MNRYPPARINPFVGVAAVAMSVLTFTLAVGVPSSIAPTHPDATTLTKSAPVTVEIAILPPIEVIAVRDTTVANRQSKPRG
jgi:Mg2+/Co2+ transporter CorB